MDICIKGNKKNNNSKTIVQTIPDFVLGRIWGCLFLFCFVSFLLCIVFVVVVGLYFFPLKSCQICKFLFLPKMYWFRLKVYENKSENLEFFISLVVFTHAVITGHKFTGYKSDAIKIFSLIHQRVHTSQY